MGDDGRSREATNQITTAVDHKGRGDPWRALAAAIAAHAGL